MVPAVQLHTTQQIGRGGATTIGLPIPIYTGPTPIYNVSSLPTDPGALRKVIDAADFTRRFPIQSVGLAFECETKACRRFVRAAALLQGPDVGASPAFRQALFRVMATVPGVRLLGHATDRTGRSGIGLAIDQRFDGRAEWWACTAGDAHPVPRWGPGYYRLQFPAIDVRFTIVIDQRTTELLSAATSATHSGPPVKFPPACGSIEQSALTPTWAVVVKSGIVDSDTMVPGG